MIAGPAFAIGELGSRLGRHEEGAPKTEVRPLINRPHHQQRALRLGGGASPICRERRCLPDDQVSQQYHDTFANART